MASWVHVASRYWFPDEDFNSGLHHHHPAAVGHCRAREVRCITVYSHVYRPFFMGFHNWHTFWFHCLFFRCNDSFFLFLFLILFRFRSITEQYYRKADAILAMYDVAQTSSFTAVRAWMDSVKVSRWRCNREKTVCNADTIQRIWTCVRLIDDP